MDYTYGNSGISGINENYLREMEKNSLLFEQKMKKLNTYNFSEPSPSPSTPHPQLTPTSSQNNNDKIIEQLQNEIAYKDSLIEELQSKKNDINDYDRDLENMQNELEAKSRENSRLKEENENLKLKVENLKIENTNFKSNKEKHMNQNENLSIALSEAKEEIQILRKKLNETELVNKKLNKDYDQLNKNFALARKENQSLKAEIDEHKATIYNLNHDLNENKKNLEKKKNYGQETPQIQNQQQQSKMYNNTPSPSIRSAYGYNNININSHYDGFNYFPSEHKIKENMIEMNSLDMELNALLKEKTLLENELFKLPERPRTLNEIKAKKEKNEQIKAIEDRVGQIKMRIRALNN